MASFLRFAGGPLSSSPDEVVVRSLSREGRCGCAEVPRACCDCEPAGFGANWPPEVLGARERDWMAIVARNGHRGSGRGVSGGHGIVGTRGLVVWEVVMPARPKSWCGGLRFPQGRPRLTLTTSIIQVHTTHMHTPDDCYLLLTQLYTHQQRVFHANACCTCTTLYLNKHMRNICICGSPARLAGRPSKFPLKYQQTPERTDRCMLQTTFH